MRMMLTAQFPNEPFNTLVKKGQAGPAIGRILEELKPEAVYFTEQHGGRCAVLIVDVKEPSQVPALAEPLFLAFNAECRFRIVMTPEDLGKAGLDSIGKAWA
ncbi:MAG: panthothenate synthetase [Acidobacteriota bacterium]